MSHSGHSGHSVGASVAQTEYLESNVEVEEAHGALLSQFVLLLNTTHLHDAQALWLSWEGLHAQGLEAVLKAATSSYFS